MRRGDGSAPFSAISRAGCTAPGAGGRRIQGQQRIEHGIGEIDVDGRLQLGAFGPDHDVAQARLPGADADRRRRRRHRQAGIVERAGDKLAHAVAFNRDAELDTAGGRAEHIRIESDELGLFERDGAEAGQRADESRGAAAGTLDLGVQGQMAGRRRAIGAGQDRAELGAGDAGAKPRGQTGGAVGHREPAVEAALADFARDVLEHHLRAVEPCNAGEPLRHQPRREHRALRIEGDAPVEAGCAPSDRLGGPAVPCPAALGRDTDRGGNHRRHVERFRLDRSVDPRHVAEAICPLALHLLATDRAGELVEINRRRLVALQQQRALATDVDRPGGKLTLNRNSRPSGPFAEISSRAGF